MVLFFNMLEKQAKCRR